MAKKVSNYLKISTVVDIKDADEQFEVSNYLKISTVVDFVPFNLNKIVSNYLKISTVVDLKISSFIKMFQIT